MPEDSKARKRLEEMMCNLLKKCEDEKHNLKFPRAQSENAMTFFHNNFKEWEDLNDQLKNDSGSKNHIDAIV